MWYEVFYPGTSTSNFLAQENMHMSKQALVHICDTGFTKHQRSENSPSTTHNSLAKFRWSMAILFGQFKCEYVM